MIPLWATKGETKKPTELEGVPRLTDQKKNRSVIKKSWGCAGRQCGLVVASHEKKKNGNEETLDWDTCVRQSPKRKELRRRDETLCFRCVQDKGRGAVLQDFCGVVYSPIAT